MSSKLAASRFIAQTFRAIRQQGGQMMAAAPWSFGAFMLSLPFALLVSKIGGPIQYGFLVLALINLLALARMTFAWHRVIVVGGSPDSAIVRGGNAEAKHLALLMLFIVLTAALLRATSDIPILLYFAMDGVGDTRFFIALFAVLAALWAPLLLAGAGYALSLPRAAVAGEYGFQAMRAAMRFKRWPLAVALLVLILCVSMALAMLVM